MLAASATGAVSFSLLTPCRQQGIDLQCSSSLVHYLLWLYSVLELLKAQKISIAYLPTSRTVLVLCNSTAALRMGVGGSARHQRWLGSNVTSAPVVPLCTEYTGLFVFCVVSKA